MTVSADSLIDQEQSREETDESMPSGRHAPRTSSTCEKLPHTIHTLFPKMTVLCEVGSLATEFATTSIRINTFLLILRALGGQVPFIVADETGCIGERVIRVFWLFTTFQGMT
jgi:hypothetical protein